MHWHGGEVMLVGQHMLLGLFDVKFILKVLENYVIH